MKNEITRRGLMKGITTAALAPALLPVAAQAQQGGDRQWWMGNGMPQEGPDTPKLAITMSLREDGIDEAIRGLTQIGVTHAISGGPRIPWDADQLKTLVARLKAGGVTLGNLMIAGFPKTIYGQPGRDEEIEKVKQSLEAAGKAGIPVVEYNFYAHRATEGYFDELGRGGSELDGSDYEHMKGLPPLPNEGAHTLTEMWENISYFLKAVIPVAEKANVRMALHPNDPPYPLSRGSQQIMGSLDGWKHLIEIVDSPSNGITWDCGVTREMGEDPIAVCQYFGSRDRINHVHYRNVHVFKPSEDYVEVFIDEGDNNMLAVMRQLLKVKYTRELYPEHPRGIDYDKGHPGAYAAQTYNVAYAKAMMQAALLLEQS